jgi:hypothetical protein
LVSTGSATEKSKRSGHDPLQEQSRAYRYPLFIYRKQGGEGQLLTQMGSFSIYYYWTENQLRGQGRNGNGVFEGPWQSVYSTRLQWSGLPKMRKSTFYARSIFVSVSK